MAVMCPGCGSENADGARFCRVCGAPIVQPAAATVMQPPQQPPAPDPSMAPTTGMPPVTPPPAPSYTPPAQAYTPPPQAYAQPAQPQAYMPAQPAYQQPSYPAAYPPAARAGSQKGTAFYVGAAIVLLCGLLVLVCTFMPWLSVGGGGGYVSVSFSGWDTRDMIENGFFDWGDGKPLFSGYFSLILGIVTLLLGALLLATRSKGLAGLLLLLFIVSLCIAGINTYSILTVEEGFAEYSLGAGMILFLAGSAGGTIGSIVCMAG